VAKKNPRVLVIWEELVGEKLCKFVGSIKSLLVLAVLQAEVKAVAAVSE